jgi:nicotinate-nucleotide--dimethylbenzimidazole phosphoribosyltransferase
MVANMLEGGAAVSVLARLHGLGMTVVDAGIAHALPARPGLLDRAVRRGTADALLGPAMDTSECDQALAAGADVLAGLPGNALLVGEMGIGNTSAASLLMARLSGLPLEACVGRGTGLDDAGLTLKRKVLQAVLDRHRTAVTAREALAAFGGFEIAMLVGAMLQAAHERRLVVVDGFITGAAALVAQRMAPHMLDYCVFSHCGAEAGHAALLQVLGARALLDLGLRLGEGSGAALAWPLVSAAERLLAEMATFASAGVSHRSPRHGPGAPDGSADIKRDPG